MPLAFFKKGSGIKRKKNEIYKWVKKDFEPFMQNSRNNVSTNECKSLTPLQIFEKIFDNTLIQLFIEESNIYANQKNKQGSINCREIKAFLGVLVLSGYLQLPRRRLYWEREKDTHNVLVSEAISRDRFEFIMSHFHLADNNNLDQEDRFAKVRPLFRHLNRKFLEMAPLEEAHSVDEAMVPYFGHHGCKQYIHGKPIRYGYKLWMGCTRLGYVNWFEPYQGASTHIGETYRELGVGAGVVLTYSDILRTKWPDAEFHLFFDNFFNSCPLLKHLSEKKIKGTGTIRTNRIPNNPFSTTNMKKRKRGDYDYRMCETHNMVAVQWNDNSVVTMCSNAVGVRPIHNVKRYSSREKKSVYIQQPQSVKLYNANMGGVDRCDENISLYRTSIRGKKWYWPLIAQGLDMAIHNAWQYHKTAKGDLDHLTFRRQIALGLLQQNKKISGVYSRGRPGENENAAIRYDRMDHLVIPQDRQTKCRHCHTKTTTRCQKCDCGLHVKCFYAFHTL